jgi:hypothetical protein
MDKGFTNRSAWVVEWYIPSHEIGFKSHELRPHFLPRRYSQEGVFDFMKCLFWNSALFSPTAMLQEINKPRFSRKTQRSGVYRIANGARLSYGCLGDPFHLVAGLVKDLCITRDIDQFVVKWTRPAGAKPDDVTGRVVQDGLPVERHWIWKKGQWFCDSYLGGKLENLPARL